MKRNEKILVYGVTGFLAVVLFIAILFSPDELGTREPKHIADLLREDDEAVPEGGPSTTNPGPSGGEEAAGGEEAGEDVPEASGAGDGAGAGEPPAEDGEAAEAAATADGEPVGPEALRAETPASRVRSLFGPSEKLEFGNDLYRRVEVARGDSLNLLAQRWCGSVDYAGEIRSLNETVDFDDLHPGKVVTVPWVDDAELLAAHEERQSPAAAPPAAPGPLPGGTREYVVEEGDTVWQLAVSRVGVREAPNYIERLEELNPQIEDLGAIGVGTRLIVPAK